MFNFQVENIKTNVGRHNEDQTNEAMYCAHGWKDHYY